MPKPLVQMRFFDDCSHFVQNDIVYKLSEETRWFTVVEQSTPAFMIAVIACAPTLQSLVKYDITQN